MSQNVAIVAITKNGVELGQRLTQLFLGSHLYVPAKFASGQKVGEYPFQEPVKEVVARIFSKYKSLVLIMATGIAVRLVASELRGKHEDPAVVVMDEKGKFVVSLLSGHVGGANQLAGKIASLTGAQSVITTASDVSRTIAVDLLGREFGWEVEDDANVSKVSAAIINGDEVGVYQDTGERNWWQGALPENIREFFSLEDLGRSTCLAALVITDRLLGQEYQALLDRTMIYRPKSLVVGIGCNRGVPCFRIEEAIAQVLLEHGLSIKSIRNIATIDLKRNELGLLEFARKCELPIEFFTRETLIQVKFPSAPSTTTLKWVGTPAVCEPAALLSSQSKHLVVSKTKLNDVTIAVARVSFNSSEKQESGKLFLVGIGPGDPEQMTFKAREALAWSNVIVGYKTYVKLIEQFLSQKEVIAGGMGGEVERMKRAVSLAEDGKTVAVVCSGDAGIYGMAGLVGEIMQQQRCPAKFEIEVIPGVPSLCAAASLLGAPIMHDFASISLSDRLTPWRVIALRLRMAAKGDFVIALHNPKSRERRHQLVDARKILLRYRSRSTPVGIVDNAYRQGQKITITDLEHMLDFDIGMSTTIIVGNSTTFTFDRWMVTPRGYRAKYRLGEGENKCTD
ncbi:MAG: precorrin-3B C(17)-methyltransferase [Dehalococcoidia bacterium]|nr:Cobalt-precorrin-5A hydrolase [Chloroflexota bacterium]MBT9159142.1 Cobalt-precorrin-5A hydrolase [Chloroflexota bacterium]